ncbi:MAG: hypothetical protein U1E52_02060 [Geminicoccaceae bacterium]
MAALPDVASAVEAASASMADGADDDGAAVEHAPVRAEIRLGELPARPQSAGSGARYRQGALGERDWADGG